MTHWDDRYTSHAVFETLKRFRQALSSTRKLLESPETREAHTRLVQVASYVRRSLESADPALSPPGTLNRINQHLAEASAQVEHFAGDGQQSYLDAANNHADLALEQVSQLPIPKTPADVKGIKADVVSFRKSAGAHLRYLTSDFQEARSNLEEQVSKTRSSVEEAQQLLESRIAEQLSRTEVSFQKTEKQIEARLQELNAEKARLDKAIAEFQEQFSKAEETRRERFSDLTDEQQDEFRALLDQSRESLQAQLTSVSEHVENVIEQLKEQQEEVEKIVGAVGATGMSAGFQTAADYEKKQAEIWRLVGVAALVAIVFVALFTFAPPEEGLDWITIARKVLVSTPLGALAAYALTEAGRHRRRQTRNRRLALELASIDPYLARLPESDQHTVKKTLVERWFAQKQPPTKEEAVTQKSLLNLIRDLVKEVVRKS